MPPDENDVPEQTASGPLPLGRSASRAVVIGSILFVLAVSGGGTWLMLSMDRPDAPPPPETTVAPADTGDTSSMSDVQ